MENYIKIGDKEFTCEPSNDKEYNDCINACIAILATMVQIGTNGIKEDKVRAEKVMKMSGEIGGAIAKNAIIAIANEKQAKPGTPPESGHKDA